MKLNTKGSRNDHARRGRQRACGCSYCRDGHQHSNAKRQASADEQIGPQRATPSSPAKIEAESRQVRFHAELKRIRSLPEDELDREILSAKEQLAHDASMEAMGFKREKEPTDVF